MERLTEISRRASSEEEKDANPDAGEGAKAKKEEGKVGKKESKMKEAKGDKVEHPRSKKTRKLLRMQVSRVLYLMLEI